MRKVVLTFGFISGAILSAMMLLTAALSDHIGYDKAMFLGYATMVAGFLMVFVGVKSYRDNVAGGRITFGKAFSIGLLIMLIGSLCYVATWEVVSAKVFPDFAQKYSAHMMDQARASGATEAQLAERQHQMDQWQQAY